MPYALGKMQTDFLEHLEAAKLAHANGSFMYAGGMEFENSRRLKYDTGPPTVRSRGEVFTLGEGVYDLRATAAFLALYRRQARPDDDRMGWHHAPPAFRASFSRAVRGLIARGLLERYVETGREIRFVTRREPP